MNDKLIMNKTSNDARQSDSLFGNYFISAYPPFSRWGKEKAGMVEQALQKPSDTQLNTPFGLYVHIPFCDVRCSYCYYLSYANKPCELIDQYIDALLAELQQYSRMPALVHRALNFVYFGGGTPSSLSEEQLMRLMSGLQKYFSWSAVKEVTFECAPASATKAKLRALRDAGVTRISMGVQQLNDAVLAENGRIHRIKDVLAASDNIKTIGGFKVVNLDLIVGLTGESEQSFMDSLERVISLNPDSITIYQLEIPWNTPLRRAYSEGSLKSPIIDRPTKRACLKRGFSKLEQAGFELRSAYTAGKSTARKFHYQDAQYQGADLIGIGSSAFSYFDGVHYQNIPSLQEYLKSVSEVKLPVERAYHLNDQERLIREFILQLKLGKVDCNQFREKFKADIKKAFYSLLTQFEKTNLLYFNDNEIILTRDGLLQVDEMLPLFYLPEHQNIRYS